jgi:hypothetical protein
MRAAEVRTLASVAFAWSCRNVHSLVAPPWPFVLHVDIPVATVLNSLSPALHWHWPAPSHRSGLVTGPAW